MDLDTLVQNVGTGSVEDIFFAIEKLQQLGGIENWNEQRAHAEQLLQEWFDLSDDIPEDQEVPAIDLRAEWLWNQLDRPQLIQSESPVEPGSEIEEQPLVIDVDRWVKEASNLLREGWQQFGRFRFRCDVDSDSGTADGIDGDLASKATFLWMEYEDLLPVIAQNRFFEVFTLWSELEDHLDPDRSIQNGRQNIRDQRRSEGLKQQGKHQAADQWLLPKDQWKRPSKCSEEDWLNIIKPFNRDEYNEPIKEFLAKVELACAGRVPSKGTTAVQALNHYQEDALRAFFVGGRKQGLGVRNFGPAFV